MIWDVKVTPNWIPLFNANRGDPANYNDAEFFITPAGQFYINGAGYLGAEGTVQPDTWYRIGLYPGNCHQQLRSLFNGMPDSLDRDVYFLPGVAANPPA